MKLTRNDYHTFVVFDDTLTALASGEVFILDDMAKALLKSEANSEKEAVKLLSSRFSPEMIINAYCEMNQILSRPIKNHENYRPPRKLRALCLNITHRCNLACEYCFAGKLTNEHAPSMTWEVVRAAFDFLFCESEGVRKLQVDFFGGEPLLVFDRVKEAVKYGRSLEKKFDKSIQFTLTTNATLMGDEIIDFIRENNISLILSLDGRKKQHDLYRRYRGGKGSFDIVLNNIERVKRRSGKNDYYIRGTFTSNTLDILSTLKFYNEMGYYNVSIEPVASRENSGYALGQKHLKTLLSRYREAAKWMLDKPLNFYHFDLEMNNPLCLTRRITGCGAGVEYMAVDPLGDLYPCHQFIDGKFKLGNVFTGVESRAITEVFRNSTIYDKERCSSCWARFYCGGGCHFTQYLESGSIKRPSSFHCKLFRERLEVALWYNVKKRLMRSNRKNVKKA